MKFAIISLNDTQDIVEMLESLGLPMISEDDEKPDFVITYGEDETILYAERQYPGIPKITLRGSEEGYKCLYLRSDLEYVLLKIEDEEYRLREELKLETQVKEKDYSSHFLSLNEIQLHNPLPTQAVRFSVYEDSIHKGVEPLFDNITGDGVVVATPFGSTAYYSSVGGEKFSRGIGIALNNPYKIKSNRHPRIVDDSSKIIIKILRDNGLFTSDNDDRIINVKGGDEIIVRTAKDNAKFVIIWIYYHTNI